MGDSQIKMKCPIEVLKMVLSREVGEDTLELVQFLKKNGETSEFVLAKKLKEDVNGIRNQIYRLQKVNLVKYSKKKDKEKGWYVYFWDLKLENFGFRYHKILENEILALEKIIKRKEDKEFFTCKNNCVEINYEDGLNSNYTCPECGEALDLCDVKKEIEVYKKRIERLKQYMDKYSSLLQ